MQLISPLLSLGFTENEAKLLLTLWQIGQNPVSVIAKKANISRTTSYAALESLKKKGVASSIVKSGIQQYAPISPRKLAAYAKRKEETALQSYLQLKELLPEFESLTGDLILPPKVRFFEGEEGIKNILNDTLETLGSLPENERVKFSYSTGPVIHENFKNLTIDYIKERHSAAIRIKEIINEYPNSHVYQQEMKALGSEVRVVPSHTNMNFSADIGIYAQKLAVISFNAERPHGVVIESKEISHTQKAIFLMTWNICAS